VLEGTETFDMMLTLKSSIFGVTVDLDTSKGEITDSTGK